MVQQKRLLSPLPVSWGTEPRPRTPIKQAAGPCGVTSSAVTLQHQHESTSHSFTPTITTNIPVPLRLTTLHGLPSPTNQLLSFCFPSSLVPSPHLQLHFILGTIISLLIQYQPFGKTVYFIRDSKRPRKSLGSNFRNLCTDGPFGPGRCRCYMGPPNQKPVSRESSLHALLQRCGLTRFSQIIKGQHEWASHHQKAVSGRDKSRKERVTSIFAWFFITHTEQRKVSSSWMRYNTAAEGHNWPRCQLTLLISCFTANLVHSSAPSLLFAFIHLSLAWQKWVCNSKIPLFKMRSDKSSP